MGKRRKTHKEKVIADLRRRVYSLEVQKPMFSEAKELRSAKIMPTFTQASTASIISHPYLTKDIFKTGFVTGVILLMQIVLNILLKNHVFAIPMVSY